MSSGAFASDMLVAGLVVGATAQFVSVSCVAAAGWRRARVGRVAAVGAASLLPLASVVALAVAFWWIQGSPWLCVALSAVPIASLALGIAVACRATSSSWEWHWSIAHVLASIGAGAVVAVVLWMPRALLF